jgi:hypothetical protein
LGFILQEEVTLTLIYHLVEFGSIWAFSSSGGPNPWSSQSSAGRTSNLRVRPNPSFCIGAFILHSSLWEAYLCFREHFVAAHILVLKPSEVIPDLLLYCIRCLLSYNKRSDLVYGSISCVLLRSLCVELHLE